MKRLLVAIIYLFIGSANAAFGQSTKQTPLASDPPAGALACKQVAYVKVDKAMCKSGVQKLVGGCGGTGRQRSCA